jgi:transketolase
MSAADLMAVLITRHLGYNWDSPDPPVNDHLIFSKGHASPLLYSVYKAVGVVSDDELMSGYRRFGQRLEGHPTPVLPWVDVATGWLGQGLPDGVGIALAGKYLDRMPCRVWVLCGDSELAEGSIWEVLDKAPYYKLSNLIAIVDVNRLGQRWETAGRPSVILAKTIKGHGFSEVENKNGWHGKALPPEMAERAIAERGRIRNLVVRGPLPEAAARGPVPGKPTTISLEPARTAPSGESPTYEVGEKIQTRRVYGEAIVALGARDTGSWRWTARSETRRTRISSHTRSRTGISRCSSPSSRCYPHSQGCRCAATKHSRRRSRRS